MKTLYLVRHAKSSWSQTELPDFDRPLNDRGNRDKKTMGNRLAEQKVEIDLVLSSSAKRTIQTTHGLAKELDINSDIITFLDELYHSNIPTLLETICSAPNCVNKLMVVAHNPGVSNLCDYLCDFAVNFPTLGVAKINFETDSWEEVSAGTGMLDWYDYPKK